MIESIETIESNQNRKPQRKCSFVMSAVKIRRATFAIKETTVLINCTVLTIEINYWQDKLKITFPGYDGSNILPTMVGNRQCSIDVPETNVVRYTKAMGMIWT